MFTWQRSSSQYVEMADGINLHLRRWTYPHEQQLSQAVVFLHGFGEGGFVWDNVVSRIADQINCIALDFRGHGDSGRAHDGKYDMEVYTSDFISMVNKLGIRRLLIVGHSMGADVAIRASVELRSRLAGLVIVDYGPEVNEEGRKRVREDFENSLQSYESAAQYQAYLESTRILSSPELLAQFALHATRKGDDNYFYLKADPALVNGLEKKDPQVLWELLRKIECPTLLIRGAGSAVLSQATARRMAACMPRCVFQQVDIAGHAVMLDNPDGFAKVVTPFLKQYFQPLYAAHKLYSGLNV